MVPITPLQRPSSSSAVKKKCDDFIHIRETARLTNVYIYPFPSSHDFCSPEQPWGGPLRRHHPRRGRGRVERSAKKRIRKQAGNNQELDHFNVQGEKRRNNSERIIIAAAASLIVAVAAALPVLPAPAALAAAPPAVTEAADKKYVPLASLPLFPSVLPPDLDGEAWQDVPHCGR